MLFVNKKSNAPGSAPAASKGLFVNSDRNQVVDVESRTVEDVDFSEPAKATVGPLTPPPVKRPLNGFASLRVKKTMSSSDDVGTSTEPSKVSAFSSLKARFSSKTLVVAKDAPTASDSDLDAPASTETANAPKAEKSAKLSKSAKETKSDIKSKKAVGAASKSGGKADKRVILMTELDGGRQLFWTLESDKLAPTTEVPVGSVLSFSKDDSRFKAEGNLSFKQALDVALLEIGEAVQVVNRSKDLGAVYATRMDRAMDSKFRLVPAQQALDRILTERKKSGTGLICGFLLKDASTDVSLAVIYHINQEGESSKPQISVNPDSMEFVIAQFSASRKLDKNTTEVALFNNAEFLAAAAGASSFPNEAIWRGLPVRQILSGVAVTAIAASFSLAGWTGYEFQRQHSAQSKKATLTATVVRSKAELSSMILASVPDFVTSLSLDVPYIGKQAQQLWMPDIRLTLTADLISARYTVLMPVSRAVTFNNRPTALDPITGQHQLKLVNYTAPEGCLSSPIGATGALNETQITITCEIGNTSLAHYRND